MTDLIEALQIFLKYENLAYPFHCEHDILYIMGIDPSKVSVNDKHRLKKLDFFVEDGGFVSYRFGSA